MNRPDLKPFWRKHHYLAGLIMLLIVPLFLVASFFHAFWNCSPVLTRYFEETFENIADSCDGTGISRYTHMRNAIAKRKNQNTLFEFGKNPH